MINQAIGRVSFSEIMKKAKILNSFEFNYSEKVLKNFNILIF